MIEFYEGGGGDYPQPQDFGEKEREAGLSGLKVKEEGCVAFRSEEGEEELLDGGREVVAYWREMLEEVFHFKVGWVELRGL